MELHAIKAFYDQREGLVELEDDVLSIVRQVKEATNGRVTIHWEPSTEHYVFVEACEDGTDRLIFTVSELDPRALERLQKADSRLRGYEDAYEVQERAQDEGLAQRDAAAVERLMEAGEQLDYYLNDGKYGPAYMPRGSLTPGRDIRADGDG